VNSSPTTSSAVHTRHLTEWSTRNAATSCVLLAHDEKRLIKRVIGLPGDTIELRTMCSSSMAGRSNTTDRRTTPARPCAADRAGRVFATNSSRPDSCRRRHPLCRRWRNFAPLRVPMDNTHDGRQRDDSFDPVMGSVDRKTHRGPHNRVVLSLDRTHCYPAGVDSSPHWKANRG